MQRQLSLSETWHKLCARYTADHQLIGHCWQELEIAYTAKGRHYHNLQHISELLLLAASHSAAIEDPDPLHFAIFYHDVVYSPLRKDNEEKSAELAVERLQSLGLNSQTLGHIRQMILATKTHAPGINKDTDLLLDLDLAILGSNWEQYLAYSRQIRKEYSIIPYFLYRKGRKKVLQHFLDLPRIYKAQLFYELHEAAAKENLSRELQLLQK